MLLPLFSPLYAAMFLCCQMGPLGLLPFCLEGWFLLSQALGGPPSLRMVDIKCLA